MGKLLGSAQSFRLQPSAARSAALHKPSVAENRTHCLSGKPLKHSQHYFRIRASVAQYVHTFWQYLTILIAHPA